MEPLEKAREKRQKMKEMGIAHTYESNLIIKAQKNPKSLKKAIAATCFHCFGGTESHAPDPGWKQSIRECISSCPLYRHRPYK